MWRVNLHGHAGPASRTFFGGETTKGSPACRLRNASASFLTSFPYSAEIICLCKRSSSAISSRNGSGCDSVFMALIQFFRAAHHRHGKTVRCKVFADPFPDEGVRDVFEIPSDKVVHPPFRNHLSKPPRVFPRKCTDPVRCNPAPTISGCWLVSRPGSDSPKVLRRNSWELKSRCKPKACCQDFFRNGFLTVTAWNCLPRMSMRRGVPGFERAAGR